MGKGANRRNRRKKYPTKNVYQNKSPDTQLSVTRIPKIFGADFSGHDDSVQKYQDIIDATPHDGGKRRVLFICEASYLRTGFSTYLHEIFTRLHATGKYDLAEFGSYGDAPHIDPRAGEVKWKYYHNLPTSLEEAREYGFVDGQVVGPQYSENQFGKWRLPLVLADFKPDIVISIRDNWMDKYVKDCPFREYFHWIWMPTVDGYPQRWDWLKDYNQVDTVLAYSWFGKKVLETQSKTPMSQIQHIKPIKVKDVCQPGADPQIFKPLPKKEVRKIFGIPDTDKNGAPLRFVGTVMRNQPRKLFPRILEAFEKFKSDHPDVSKGVMLLCHTSIPDVGWDIPALAAMYGLQDHVAYSYMCLKCGNIAVSSFLGSPTTCPICKTPESFGTPNTKFGFTPEHLNLIYNLMDVYIQGSIAEGDGMPVNEAKMAGVPCLVSDYSALYEKARNGGALPIHNDTIYTEHETGQWRSLFSRSDLSNKLASLLRNEDKRQKLAKEAQECAMKYYTWDLCSKKWESLLDSIAIRDRKETWDSPIEELKKPNPNSPPEGLSDEEFVEWLYINILCRQGSDSSGKHYWCQILQNKNVARKDIERHFRALVEKENAVKMLRKNPKNPNTRPEDVIREAIIKAEGAL